MNGHESLFGARPARVVPLGAARGTRDLVVVDARREARRARRATRAMASSMPTSTRGLARARAVVARGARRGTNRSSGGGDARRRRATTTRAVGGGAGSDGEARDDDDDDDDDGVASRRAMRRARRERAESTREGEATEEEAAEAAASAERWMKILKEESARDPEIASLLESANGDPRAVEAKIRERFETKREKIYQERSGSTPPPSETRYP